MRSWQRKAIVDAGKSFLPFQTTLRQLKRRVSPYVSDSGNDRHLVGDAARQIQKILGLGFALNGADVVEIGTGWNPILPLMYAGCGAASVTTVDQERLLDTRLVRFALGLLERHEAAIHSFIGRTDIFKLPRASTSGANDPLTTLLATFAITYRAPYSFGNLRSGSADMVVSRDVLEHVPEQTLGELFAHMHRILRPGGVLCHSIDMSDHWEHVDKSISRVNFLKYDGWLWDLAGTNPQNFQNRLRRFEYLALLERHGFEVLHADGVPDPAALAAVNDLALCRRYAGVPPAELAVLHTTIIARPRP